MTTQDQEHLDESLRQRILWARSAAGINPFAGKTASEAGAMLEDLEKFTFEEDPALAPFEPGLAREAQPSEMDAIVAKLKSADSIERVDALKSLMAFRLEGVTEEIVCLVSNLFGHHAERDEIVSDYAAMVLGRIGEPATTSEVIKGIIRLLSSKRPMAWDSATSLVCHLAPHMAAPHLSDSVRRLEKELSSMMASSDRFQSEAAAEAARSLSKSVGLASLWEKLLKKFGLRMALSDSLSDMGRLQAELADVTQSYLESLGQEMKRAMSAVFPGQPELDYAPPPPSGTLLDERVKYVGSHDRQSGRLEVRFSSRVMELENAVLVIVAVPDTAQDDEALPRRGEVMWTTVLRRQDDDQLGGRIRIETGDWPEWDFSLDVRVLDS